MQAFTANDAEVNFRAFLDAVQSEPVRVTQHGRVVGVMVSAQDYEAMRAFYANRLQQTLAEAGAHAAAQGMTPEALEDLLGNES